MPLAPRIKSTTAVLSARKQIGLIIRSFAKPSKVSISWSRPFPLLSADSNTFTVRKTLYRAGSVLQDMFYAYQGELFDKPITKIEKKDDGAMIIHIRKHDSKIMSEYHVLQRFAPSMIPDPKNKQLLLAYMAGKEPLVVMYHFVGVFLSGKQRLSISFPGNHTYKLQTLHQALKSLLSYPRMRDDKS